MGLFVITLVDLCQPNAGQTFLLFWLKPKKYNCVFYIIQGYKLSSNDFSGCRSFYIFLTSFFWLISHIFFVLKIVLTQNVLIFDIMWAIWLALIGHKKKIGKTKKYKFFVKKILSPIWVKALVSSPLHTIGPPLSP